jgi:hypothetical protein
MPQPRRPSGSANKVTFLKHPAFPAILRLSDFKAKGIQALEVFLEAYQILPIAEGNNPILNKNLAYIFRRGPDRLTLLLDVVAAVLASSRRGRFHIHLGDFPCCSFDNLQRELGAPGDDGIATHINLKCGGGGRYYFFYRKTA